MVASLCLAEKPSLVAAAALLAAINISANEQLARSVGLQYVKPPRFYVEGEPLSCWADEIVLVSRVFKSEIGSVY